MNEQKSTLESADAAPPPPQRNEGKIAVALREVRKAPLSAQFGLLVIGIGLDLVEFLDQ